MNLVLIPNQSKYYTDGEDLYSFRKSKYRESYYWKHTGWRLTYNYEWRFYIKKQYRKDNKKLFYYKSELSNYIKSPT